VDGELRPRELLAALTRAALVVGAAVLVAIGLVFVFFKRIVKKEE